MVLFTLKIDMKLDAKNNEVREATRSKPSIVICKAADCEEEERSSLLKKKKSRVLWLTLRLSSMENSKKDFNVGEEIRVECSSFSGKGFPNLTY
ncbi:hypothetical protein QQ045_017574 [Rhodiola kirilowii]